MQQQIVIIPGANSYATYEDFIADLWKQIVSLEWLHTGSWKRGLQETLGDGYEVIQPQMPNRQNAKYMEWKIWFEKYLPHLRDGVILIGHSVGGVFLAKYLAENNISVKVHATFLIAAPYNEDGGRPLPEFSISESNPSQHVLKKFEEQGGDIYLYHSKDDPVVAFNELAKYTAQLPNVHVQIFEDRQHFNQEKFPELVEQIKSLH